MHSYRGNPYEVEARAATAATRATADDRAEQRRLGGDLPPGETGDAERVVEPRAPEPGGEREQRRETQRDRSRHRAAEQQREHPERAEEQRQLLRQPDGCRRGGRARPGRRREDVLRRAERDGEPDGGDCTAEQAPRRRVARRDGARRPEAANRLVLAYRLRGLPQVRLDLVEDPPTGQRPVPEASAKLTEVGVDRHVPTTASIARASSAHSFRSRTRRERPPGVNS